jgi:hypothetical protein
MEKPKETQNGRNKLRQIGSTLYNPAPAGFHSSSKGRRKCVSKYGAIIFKSPKWGWRLVDGHGQSAVRSCKTGRRGREYLCREGKRFGFRIFTWNPFFRREPCQGRWAEALNLKYCQEGTWKSTNVNQGHKKWYVLRYLWSLSHLSLIFS